MDLLQPRSRQANRDVTRLFNDKLWGLLEKADFMRSMWDPQLGIYHNSSTKNTSASLMEVLVDIGKSQDSTGQQRRTQNNAGQQTTSQNSTWQKRTSQNSNGQHRTAKNSKDEQITEAIITNERASSQHERQHTLSRKWLGAHVFVLKHSGFPTQSRRSPRSDSSYRSGRVPNSRHVLG